MSIAECECTFCSTPGGREVIEGVPPEVGARSVAASPLSMTSDNRSSLPSSSRIWRLPKAVAGSEGETALDNDITGATGSEMGVWASAGDTVVAGDDAAEQVLKYCGLPNSEETIESGEDIEEMGPKRGKAGVACPVGATVPPSTMFA